MKHAARAARLIQILKAIDNIVVQAEDPKDMYDGVREYVARALAEKESEEK